MSETEKLRAETEKIRTELKNVSDVVSAALPAVAERILYDGACEPYDFDMFPSSDQFDREGKPTGPPGKGEHTVRDGVIQIKRENTEGRYEIHLRKYMDDKTERRILPKKALLGETRKIRISCEARVIAGQHTLRFLFKDEETQGWLKAVGERRSSAEEEVTSEEWTEIDVPFRIPTVDKCFLRIDDIKVSHAPSVVQIRKLIVAERV